MILFWFTQIIFSSRLSEGVCFRKSASGVQYILDLRLDGAWGTSGEIIDFWLTAWL